MSRLGPYRAGLYEALPGRVLRSIDALQPLVETAVQGEILALADELDVPVNTVCYECRLARADARVDVAVCLLPMRTAGTEDVLGRLGRRRLADPPWRRCAEFLAEWSDPASPRAAQIPFVCVAFDLTRDRLAVPLPAISLCIDPEVFARQRGLPVGPAPAVAELVALADDCHHRLRGDPATAGTLAMMARCLSHEAVLAKHISFMLSRTPATFKLDIRIAVDALAALLDRIDWPGPAESVVSSIRALAPWQRHVQLNIVLASELDARLEVELLTATGEGSVGHRVALLQQLVDAGHCDPSKAEVLRRASLYPVDRDPEGLIVARNWYLKVKFDGDRIAETKAYLGLMPRVWCDPRAVAPVRPTV